MKFPIQNSHHANAEISIDMNNKDVAKWIRRAFNTELKNVTIKARHGDNRASHDILIGMTAMVMALKAIGYRTDDHGRLRPKLTGKRVTKTQKQCRLALRASKGDMDAATELLELDLYSKATLI